MDLGMAEVLHPEATVPQEDFDIRLPDSRLVDLANDLPDPSGTQPLGRPLQNLELGPFDIELEQVHLPHLQLGKQGGERTDRNPLAAPSRSRLRSPAG